MTQQPPPTHDGDEEELEKPLLPTPRDDGHNVGRPGGVVNLVKCVLGAGLLSVPRAFSLLGVAGGSAALAGVALLTMFTIKQGVILPSLTFDRTGSLRMGTYPAAVKHWLGGTAEHILILMMMLGLLGFEASYLDIIADVLLGNTHTPGLLTGTAAWLCKCDLHMTYDHTASYPHTPDLSHLFLHSTTPQQLQPTYQETASVAANLAATSQTDGWQRHLADLATESNHLNHLTDSGLTTGSALAPVPPAPGPVLQWLLHRNVVLALTVAFIMSISMKRHMGSLSIINGIGLICLGAFLTSLIWLAVAALSQGVAHPLPWRPDWEQLGQGGLVQAANAFGVLSVLLTANACHVNVHPLMGIVKPFTRARMGTIVTITISITSAYYLLASVCAWLVFGPAIQEDILTNLSVPAMEPLVGHVVAQVMSWVLRIGYMVSILGSAILTMFPLRQAVADLILGPPPQPPTWVSPSHAETATPTLDTAGSADSATTTLIIGDSSAITNNTNTNSALFNNNSALFPNGGSVSTQHLTTSIQGDDVVDVSALAVLQAHSARRGALHAPLTVVLLATAWLLAVTVPSIWVVISLVGSVSATVLSFMMPGAMGLRALQHMRLKGLQTSAWIKAALHLPILLGACMFVNGFITLYLQRGQQPG